MVLILCLCRLLACHQTWQAFLHLPMVVATSCFLMHIRRRSTALDRPQSLCLMVLLLLRSTVLGCLQWPDLRSVEAPASVVASFWILLRVSSRMVVFICDIVDCQFFSSVKKVMPSGWSEFACVSRIAVKNVDKFRWDFRMEQSRCRS